MANIESIAPMQDFLQNEADGWISLRPHRDDLNLVIANYTPEQTFRNKWDTVTLASRGLIFRRDSGDIIARPFKKFFNANQPGTEHIDTTGAVEVTNKEDGSMGISYLAPDGIYSVATRGSMHSEQAEHATEVFRSRYAEVWIPDEDYSFIFEIIYRAGRIVVDYGTMDDLILLGAVNKATGISVDRPVLEKFGYPGPIVRTYDFPNYQSVFEAEQERNREGFVVRFNDSDERLKIKFDEYLGIHKLMFSLSPRRIWDLLIAGEDVNQWLTQLPDEFTDEAKGWRDIFVAEHDELFTDAFKAYESVKHHGQNRRAMAEELKALGLSKAVVSFAFGFASGWENERVSAAIWKSIDPRKHPKKWGNAVE
jgi:RNA ligase